MIGSGKRAHLFLILVPTVLILGLILVKCISVVKIALIALVISYLLSPLVLRLERKMPRPFAILAVYAAVILVSAGLIVLVLFPMFRELSDFPEYVYRAGNALEGVVSSLVSRFSGAGIPVNVPDSFQNALSKGTGAFLAFVFSAFSGIAGFLANALIALALSWFFLIDWEKMSIRLFLCVPSGIRPKVITALQSVRRELGGYLRAQSMLMIMMFLITSAVLFVLRVPMPVSLGGMYALLNAIPYFGPLIGTIPPVLAALTVSPIRCAYALGALLLIQQVDNYILSPRIMGAAANAGPATVLLAISAGGALLGVPGMFLALPALVTVKSVYRVFTAPKP